MKIFAAADIHGSQYRLNIILNHVEKYEPDLVVICGDITQFGPGDVAKNFLNQMNEPLGIVESGPVIVNGIFFEYDSLQQKFKKVKLINKIIS